MKGLIIIARKNPDLRRKEIVYSAQEWNEIEKKAAECHLKTSTYIRCKSLSGDIYVYDMKEIAPLLNGLRIISKNINQIAKKANETNNLYADDIDKLREEIGAVSLTVNQWLSTLTSSKV